MNLEVRICACGVEPDSGATVCVNCGAVLNPAVDTGPAPEVIDENATVPMIAPSTATDSERGYDLGAVFGSYRLVRQIGAGGMGHVFIAEHTRLGRQVALKILRTEYSGNIEAVKRFFAEAQAVNRINHENIIEVSDFIENPQGPSFYIMELLKGMDLRTLEDNAGVLPLRRTLGIVIQVCKGLGAAHDAGIVHRDLKPDNIFLVDRAGRTDFVKLLDFGIAKLMNAALDGPPTFKSMAGIVVGTPEYMAPEQAMGQAVDHRADIYSLGVIFFELVTGHRPFIADSAREIMVKHLMVAPPRPNRFRNFADAMPPALEELILACLEKEPRERPQTIKEVERRLHDILEDLPEAGQAIGLSRLLRDRRLWFAAGGALIVLGSLTAVLVSSKKSRNRTAAAQEQEGVPSHAATKAAPKPQVQISFVSSPPGATVLRAGTELGVTPFSVGFDVSPRAQVFEFRLDGWQVGRQAITLLQNATVELALVSADSDAALAVTEPLRKKRSGVKRPGPEPAKGSSPRSPAATAPQQGKSVKLDSDAVLNPFE